MASALGRRPSSARRRGHGNDAIELHPARGAGRRRRLRRSARSPRSSRGASRRRAAATSTSSTSRSRSSTWSRTSTTSRAGRSASAGRPSPTRRRSANRRPTTSLALTAAIKQLGGTPVAKPTFVFPVDTQSAFLALASELENTGVGAYNGAAPVAEEQGGAGGRRQHRADRGSPRGGDRPADRQEPDAQRGLRRAADQSTGAAPRSGR